MRQAGSHQKRTRRNVSGYDFEGVMAGKALLVQVVCVQTKGRWPQRSCPCSRQQICCHHCKIHATKRCGGIAKFVLSLVLHSGSMVFACCSFFKHRQGRSVQTCGSVHWQHGTLRRVVHVVGNMEFIKMDSIGCYSSKLCQRFDGRRCHQQA